MEITLEHIFNASPQTVYEAWLDSEKHSEMTGGECIYTKDTYSAWDEYITGKNLQLIPFSYIKQAWRSTEFEASREDSILVLMFEDAPKGKCKLTLIHSNLTDDDGQYKAGWENHYFTPMTEYFNNL